MHIRKAERCKKLKSLKAKRRRGNKELAELGAIEQSLGIDKAKASSTKELPEYLNNVTLFVEDGVKGEGGLEGTVDDHDNGVNPPLEPATKKEQQTRRKSVLGWWENEYPGKAFKSEQQCDLM